MAKLCKKCKKEFQTYQIIDGIKHNCCNRKFCLECSPFGKHNTKNIEKSTLDTESFCKNCQKILPIEMFYERPNRDKKVFSYCKSCMNILTLERQRKNKQKCVDYLGSKCSICGYSKCNAALEFHHVDPTQKDFTIGKNHGRTFENVKTELDKCILVCSTCHSEIHDGILKLPNEILKKFVVDNERNDDKLLT